MRRPLDHHEMSSTAVWTGGARFQAERVVAVVGGPQDGGIVDSGLLDAVLRERQPRRDRRDHPQHRRRQQEDEGHDGGDDPAWWNFRVPAIPAAFLLDGEGAIVAQWSGRIDPSDVRSAIESLGATD